MNMSNQPSNSFVIRFLNGTYNRGLGFEVANITSATQYHTREEANLVASQLRGSTTVYEIPGRSRKPISTVGPRWITAQHPRPTEGQLATLRVILNDLRDEAVVAHKLEGEAKTPDTRDEHAHNRFAAEAHARVMLDMLKHFGVKDLPDPLNLPRHPNLKVTP